VGRERILCLECGAGFRQLTNTHLGAHGLTAGEYKRVYGYNARRPLMCDVLCRFYAERAVTTRLADRIRRRPIVADPTLRGRGGVRAMVLEERLARREAQRRPRSRLSIRDGRGRFSRGTEGE
jgi:hypothetical protein